MRGVCDEGGVGPRNHEKTSQRDQRHILTRPTCRRHGGGYIGGWGVGTEVTPTGKSVSVSVRVVRAGEAKQREGESR